MRAATIRVIAIDMRRSVVLMGLMIADSTRWARRARAVIQQPIRRDFAHGTVAARIARYPDLARS